MPVTIGSGSLPLAIETCKSVGRSFHENPIPINPTNLYTIILHFSTGMSDSLVIFCQIYRDSTISRRDLTRSGHISANFGEFQSDPSSLTPLTSRRWVLFLETWSGLVSCELGTNLTQTNLWTALTTSRWESLDILDRVWLQIWLELSFSTHYVANYKTIHMFYSNKSYYSLKKSCD